METILAFDAAASSYSAALYKDGKIIGYKNESSTLTHSQTLLPAIEEILKKNGLTMDGIDKIALTSGPGSFTGLKIAASTAKGLAFKNDIPCVFLSTLEAMAYGHSDFEGIIACSLDARRNMLYNAVFSCKNGKIGRLTEDRQISAEEAAKETAELGRTVLSVGDGAEILKTELEKSGVSVTVPENGSIIDARGIIDAVNDNKGKIVSSFELVPEYLRKPQAEREREERLRAENKKPIL